MTPSDTLWHWVGWTAAAATLLLLVFALLGDAVRQRFRRRRRCPKCWYDLSHTPGMTCSECGYTAGRERQLLRWRWSRNWALAALVMGFASYATFRGQSIYARGWVGAVPTSLLVLSAPWLSVNGEHYAQLRGAALPRSVDAGALTRLYHELVIRTSRDSLAGWQWSLLIRGCMSAGRNECPTWEWYGQGASANRYSKSGELLMHALRNGRFDAPTLHMEALQWSSMCLQVRPQWPQGVPIYGFAAAVRAFEDGEVHVTLEPVSHGLHPIVRYDFASQSITSSRQSRGNRSEMWDDGLTILSDGAVSGETLEYELQGRRFSVLPGSQDELRWSKPYRLPVTVIDRADQVLEGVESREFAEALSKRLKPVLTFRASGPHVILNVADIANELHDLGEVTLALRIELHRPDGEPVVAHAWWALDPQPIGVGGVNSAGNSPPLGWASRMWPNPYASVRVLTSDEACAELRRNREALTLRLVGDAGTALRNFSCDRYWVGEIELPLSADSMEEPG